MSVAKSCTRLCLNCLISKVGTKNSRLVYLRELIKKPYSTQMGGDITTFNSFSKHLLHVECQELALCLEYSHEGSRISRHGVFGLV